jgi:HSP20 family protein
MEVLVMTNSLLPGLWGAGGKHGDVFSNLHREIDRVFEDFTHGAQLPWAAGNGKMLPRMEFSETEREFRLTAELPGVEESEIDISLSADMLTIKAEKKSESERKDENVHVSERSYGMFERSTRLPSAVDENKIDATLKNGVLTIVLPKTAEEQAKSRKITVKPHH